MKVVLRNTIALVVSGAALFAAGVAVRAQYGLSAAQESAKRGDWAQARSQLRRFLGLHPSDGRALLLMAEALAKDETLPAREAVLSSISYLGQVPDTSPQAAAARLHEARLRFVILLEAGRAEALLREAVEAEPDSFEAHHLLWKLFELTGRSHLAEPTFWRVYELAREGERAVLLRDWYMSQFFPSTAAAELERQLGLSGPDGQPGGKNEAFRFKRFRDAEPDAAVGRAALARWFLLEGDPSFAMTLLDQAAEAVPGIEGDPFYLATRIATLIDLGRVEEAQECLAGWPETQRTGHEYWKWRAVLLEQVGRDFAGALQAYDRALGIWPGPGDWRTQFRKAACLGRLGNHAEAEQVRLAADQVEKLMHDEVQAELRAALGDLTSESKLRIVEDFYRRLGRDREADCWATEIRRLHAMPRASGIPFMTGAVEGTTAKAARPVTEVVSPAEKTP